MLAVSERHLREPNCENAERDHRCDRSGRRHRGGHVRHPGQPKERGRWGHNADDGHRFEDDIPANQRLDPLIKKGFFEEKMVPQELLVHGAITDLNDLRGATTTTPVLGNEQISTSRLSADDYEIGAL
jgi:hypothetical protein